MPSWSRGFKLDVWWFLMYCGSWYISEVIINKILLHINVPKQQAILARISHISDNTNTSNVTCRTSDKHNSSNFLYFLEFDVFTRYALSHPCQLTLPVQHRPYRIRFRGNRSKIGLLNWIWPKRPDIDHGFITIRISPGFEKFATGEWRRHE